MTQVVLNKIVRAAGKNRKLFAVLIDPDKFNPEVIREANRARVDFLFIGGSRIRNGSFRSCVAAVRRSTGIPLVIFPGSRDQVSERADALLLLSLISGRNPDYLIGEHIRAARQLKRSRLEIIPTGYLLIGGGKKIAAQKVTHTSPIGSRNGSLAVSTAVAGELLGMKLIYLEAGSGTRNPLDPRLVKQVRRNISVPLIAGGGIDSAEKAVCLCRAGADMLVVGNGIEKDITLVQEISKAVKTFR